MFLPSYSFLDKVKAAWSASGLLKRLNEKKQVFYEPQTSGDVEGILRDYALAISSVRHSRGVKAGADASTKQEKLEQAAGADARVHCCSPWSAGSYRKVRRSSPPTSDETDSRNQLQ